MGTSDLSLWAPLQSPELKPHLQLVSASELYMAKALQLQMAWDTGVRFHTVQVRYHMFARYIEDDVIPW